MNTDPHQDWSDDHSDQPTHDHDGWGDAAHGHDVGDAAHGQHDWGDQHQAPSDSDTPIDVDDAHLETDGSLSLHAVHLQGNPEIGDFVDVRLPNGEHLAARVTEVNESDHSCRATVPADEARSFLSHLPDMVLREATEEAIDLGVDHLYHAAEDALCHGQITGGDGNALWLGGDDAGSDANGAPVFNELGELVGQVVDYNAGNGLNLLMPAEQLLSSLADFAAGATELIISAL